METLVNVVVKYLLSQRRIRIPLILFLGGWWLSSCCTVYKIGLNEVEPTPSRLDQSQESKRNPGKPERMYDSEP